jgi:hypothetical protein
MSVINNTKELSLKTCTKCNVSKALDQYHKRKQSKDGHSFFCKSCVLVHVKHYNSKPEVKSRKRAYDKALSQTTQYKERHKHLNSRKYQTDSDYRLKHNLRMRLHDALKKTRSLSDSTLELLGCTVPELKVHLEQQFQEGMSWDNYTKNGWHVDHIRPCASFDLSDPEQQRQCFHYTNLRPLWARDNLVKGSKWEE